MENTDNSGHICPYCNDSKCDGYCGNETEGERTDANDREAMECERIDKISEGACA